MAVFGILSILIVFAIGSSAWAFLTAWMLSRSFPHNIKPRSAARVKAAARWFAALYPLWTVVAVTLLSMPGIGNRVPWPLTDLLTIFFPAAAACVPLSTSLAAECRSRAVGATPLVAIGLAAAVMLWMTEGPGKGITLIWLLLAPPIWFAITFTTLTWIIRPNWPVAEDPSWVCGLCGYSLAGLNSALCPECGALLPNAAAGSSSPRSGSDGAAPPAG